VLEHIAYHIRELEEGGEASDLHREARKQSYDLGVYEKVFTPGQLVMLYDPKAAKQKLKAASFSVFKFSPLQR